MSFQYCTYINYNRELKASVFELVDTSFKTNIYVYDITTSPRWFNNYPVSLPAAVAEEYITRELSFKLPLTSAYLLCLLTNTVVNLSNDLKWIDEKYGLPNDLDSYKCFLFNSIERFKWIGIIKQKHMSYFNQ